MQDSSCRPYFYLSTKTTVESAEPQIPYLRVRDRDQLIGRRVWIRGYAETNKSTCHEDYRFSRHL
jgi:hypothetical protein